MKEKHAATEPSEGVLWEAAGCQAANCCILQVVGPGETPHTAGNWRWKSHLH